MSRTILTIFFFGLMLLVFKGTPGAQALWTANGVPICTSGEDQRAPAIASDDSGGAIIVWQDDRWGTADTDIFTQRIDASGQVKWAANGVSVSWPSGWQEAPEIIADGAGGAIIVWRDTRNGAGYDLSLIHI